MASFTITGTNNSETLPVGFPGTPNDDYTIFGNGGNDNISGFFGVDTLYGGTGNDILDGLDNNDILYGEADHDELYGGSGDDTLEGGTGNDVLYGGTGNDRLTGGFGVNDVHGDDGNDLLITGLLNSDEILNGGLGIDTVSFSLTSSSGNVSGVTVNLNLTTRQYTGYSYVALVGVENLRGMQGGNDKLIGNSGDNIIEGMTGIDILEGGAGNDTLNGAGAGVLGTDIDNTASYFSAISAVTVSLSVTGAQNTIGAGIDTLLSISHLEGSAFNDTLTGNANTNTLTGLVGNDTLNGLANNDALYGGAGNDTLNGGLGNDILDGSAGIDTAVFNINRAAVTEVRHTKTGGAYIASADGADSIFNIETLQFLDGSITAGASGDVIRDLIATRPLPTFAGATSPVSLYTGAVAFLEYEHIGSNAGDSVAGSNGNDFINLLAGDDAANGGAGDDVLDGGIGSNFLTGGGGNETFFLDGRGGTTTWSTITDFNSGDAVNIWGWNAGTSKLLLTQASAGAVGFTGVTYHYDLNNDNAIDTSITFTGLSAAQLPASQALSVAGNGYLLIG